MGCQGAAKGQQRAAKGSREAVKGPPFKTSRFLDVRALYCARVSAMLHFTENREFTCAEEHALMSEVFAMQSQVISGA